MKMRIMLPILCILMCCSNEPNYKGDSVKKGVAAKDGQSAKVRKGENINSPPNPIIDLDSFNITDYYYLFGFKADFDSFKNLDHRQAYISKTFFVQSLNYRKAFLSFQTQHTPPSWDGDSEEEMYYEIAYWNLSDESRLIALCSTTKTWVSEQSDSILFYLHDKDGINGIQLNPLSWDLGSFIGQQHESFFDKEIWEDPPILVYLPEGGRDIEVSLSFNEYMENQDAYRILDSLKIEPLNLRFDPTKYDEYRK